MKKVVFSFGRMNPPTIGHAKLVDKVKSVASKQKADVKIYLSHTQNNKKDPLTYDDKVKYAQKAFGRAVVKSKARTIIEILKELESANYTDIIMVVGSDRVQEFNRLMQKYNGKDYNFDSIKVVSAGARDPDATGVEGMSASKLRAIAVDGDFDTFQQGLPSGLSDKDKKDIYDEVRDVLSEDRQVMTIQQRMARGRLMKRLAPKLARMRKIRAKRMADAQKLKQRAQKQAVDVVRKKFAGERGSEYKQLSPSEKITIDKLVQKKSSLINKLSKKLLPKVKKAEIERLKKARASTTNEEVVVNEISKSTLSNYMKKAGDQMRQGTKGGPRTQKGVDSATKDKRRQGIHRADNKIRKMYGAPTTSPTKVAATNEAEVRQDKDIKDKEGTQPAKYYSGLSKSTKVKRDAQFKRQAAMSDDDPKAYKPAPGDATAKTKPSKYTTKYKAMYGEGKEDSDKDVNMMLQLRKAVSLRGREIEFANGEKRRISQNVAQQALNKLGRMKPIPRGDAMNKMSQSPQEFKKVMLGEMMEKADSGLQKKSEKSGIPVSILRQVYNRGVAAWRTGHRPGTTPQQWGYARVNSFITGGKTRTTADKDLWAKASSARKAKKEEFVSEEIKEIIKKLSERSKLQMSRRDAESMLLDKLKEYLKNASPDQLKHVGDMIGRKITIMGSGPKAKVVFEAVSPAQQAAIAISMKKAGKKPKNEEGGAGEEGTDKLRKKYEKDTPNSAVTEQSDDCSCGDLQVEQAEYEGRKVKLNDPFRLPAGSKKKFGVYVKNEKGNVIRLTFGDPNMEIKRDDPDRLKSFRARHNCDNPGPKWKARYWSCYQWRAGAKVDN